MVTPKILSRNLAIIMKELAKNQKIVKLLKYYDEDPLRHPDVALPAKELYSPFSKSDVRRIYPYPFSITLENENALNIRVYYPYGDIVANGARNDIELRFDIICAKNLWLCRDEVVRPYDIMDAIINHFDDRSIDTLGTIRFKRFAHLSINNDSDGVRLIAEVMTVG